MLEKVKKDWKILIVVALWIALTVFVSGKYLGNFPFNLRFTREIVSMVVDDEKNTVSVEAYMFYENQSTKPARMKILYPLHSGASVGSPQNISVTRVLCKKPKLDEIYKNKYGIYIDGKVHHAYPFLNIDYDLSEMGIFTDLDLTGDQCAVVRVRFTQPLFEDHYNGRSTYFFPYITSMNGGWGRSLDEAVYVIKSRKDLRIAYFDFLDYYIALRNMPGAVRNMDSKVKIDDDEVFKYQIFKAEKFMDRGMSILYFKDN